jgi:hypothetical protein
MCECCVREDRLINTGSLCASILIPEIASWLALENRQQEIEHRENNNHHHRSVDQVLVSPFNANPQKKDGNRESQEHSRQRIEELAEPEVHKSWRDVFFGNVLNVTTGTIMDSKGRCDRIYCEDTLCNLSATHHLSVSNLI